MPFFTIFTITGIDTLALIIILRKKIFCSIKQSILSRPFYLHLHLHLRSICHLLRYPMLRNMGLLHSSNLYAQGVSHRQATIYRLKGTSKLKNNVSTWADWRYWNSNHSYSKNRHVKYSLITPNKGDFGRAYCSKLVYQAMYYGSGHPAT